MWGGRTDAIWAIQDKLALDADEEKAIELKREFAGGQERVPWNPSFSIPAKAVDFTEAETVRMRAAVEAWSGYAAAADRRWLEPRLRLLAPAESA